MLCVFLFFFFLLFLWTHCCCKEIISQSGIIKVILFYYSNLNTYLCECCCLCPLNSEGEVKELRVTDCPVICEHHQNHYQTWIKTYSSFIHYLVRVGLRSDNPASEMLNIRRRKVQLNCCCENIKKKEWSWSQWISLQGQTVVTAVHENQTHLPRMTDGWW